MSNYPFKNAETCKYRFVVIFLPLMNLVEVDTDLKLPIPPPPPPKDEEETEVNPPPPMSPNELKPTKEHTFKKKKTSLIMKKHHKFTMNHVELFVGMNAPESNPVKPGPNAGKCPKPKSDPPILPRLAPLWRLRLPPKKSSNGSSAVEGNTEHITLFVDEKVVTILRLSAHIVLRNGGRFFVTTSDLFHITHKPLLHSLFKVGMLLPAVCVKHVNMEVRIVVPPLSWQRR